MARTPLTKAQIDAAEVITQLWEEKQSETLIESGKKMSQDEASAELGFNTQGAFSQYKNAGIGIGLEALVAFANFFKVSPFKISKEIAKPLETSLSLVTNDEFPYKHSLDLNRTVKCFKFIQDDIGYGVFQDEGPDWSADKFIKLYDYFDDPGSDGLNPETILKLIQ
jgi:hypothetical protein